MQKNGLKFDGKHAAKKNPNNDLFWQELGYEKRPDNWREEYQKIEKRASSKTRQSRRDDIHFSAIGFGYLSVDDY